MEDGQKMHFQVYNTLSESIKDARMSATSKKKGMFAEKGAYRLVSARLL